MKNFIEHLKSDEAGNIFWLNVCAHLHAQMLDIDLTKKVFSTAQNEYDSKYGARPPYAPGMVAYQILRNQTSDNTIAISAIRRVQPVDWAKITEISTVINGSSWWSYYAELKSDAYSELIEQLGTSTGSLVDFDEAKLGPIVLEKLWRENRRDLKTGFEDSLKTGIFKTGVLRFWAGIQGADRPETAEPLAKKLALTSFADEQWLIEIVFDAEVVKILLATDQENFKRPSALCVNDGNAPRFRALTPTEVTEIEKGEDLSWHGWTVDLGEWEKHTNDELNGLPELMCPAIKWSEKSPKDVKLLGQSKDITKKPSNKDFAKYLSNLFKSALANEDLFIAKLEGSHV
jgi:hypothetical protein